MVNMVDEENDRVGREDFLEIQRKMLQEKRAKKSLKWITSWLKREFNISEEKHTPENTTKSKSCGRNRGENDIRQKFAGKSPAIISVTRTGAHHGLVHPFQARAQDESV